MKKKIFIVITRLDTGGSSETVLSLRQSLSHKYDISLVAGPGGMAPDITIPHLRRDTGILADLAAFAELYCLFRKHRPDLVHTNTSKAGFLGRWAAGFAGIRKIAHTPHGHIFYGYGFSPLKEKAFLLLEKFTAPLAGLLIALTEGEKKESLERGVGKPGQWRVVHPGTEVPPGLPQAKAATRSALHIPQDDLVIGTVARLETVKGISYLLRAFKLFSGNFVSPCRLLIVGGGSLRAALEHEAETLGIRGLSVFTGERKDIFELMSAMDMYVQPSLNEGLGKTLIQAQASGLPVIGTRVQGIPDAVRENETGLLVAPGNAEQLAAALHTLAGDPEKRKLLANNAKTWVSSLEGGLPKFGTERMARLMDGIYEELLS